MNCLVIGYGSIGSRHASVLRELNRSVSIVSKRNITETTNYPAYSSLEAAFLNNNFDYVVIANNTSEHYLTVLSLINLSFSGVLLVEKPIFAKYAEIPKNNFKQIFVAYNLRFHPIIQKIYDLTRDDKIYSTQVYVGQYLPNWRPNRDYRTLYSATKEKGGGVIRDLSHELDYLLWILDGWKRVTGIGGKFGELEIETDDVFCLTMETNKCPAVMLQMNYLDHISQRSIIINYGSTTIKADLVKGIIQINDEITKYRLERNYTYRDLHKATLCGNYHRLCTFEQGLEVLSLIETAEEASEKRIWRAK
jgi:predicted dehydrogenase